MLNYRMITLLLLFMAVVFPLAFHWASAAEGAWYRPYIIWSIMVYSVYLIQRRGGRDER